MTFESVQGVGTGASVSLPGMRTDAAAPRQILCATDLSPRSQRTVTRATLLANQLDAQLTVLHVADAEQPADCGFYLRDQLEHQLASTRIPLRRDAVVQLRTGHYVEAIASVAKQIAADIVLLGAQRRKSQGPLIGTTAERVIALSGCPALIVNLNPRVRYGAVVIAAELSDAFVRVVRVASSLKLLEAKTVSVVHGFESPYRGLLHAHGFDARAAERNMEAWERAARARLLLDLDAVGVESSRFQIVFQQARPMRAIQRVVRSVRPDLLILGTKDRSMFNRVVRGSVANDVSRTIECDILVASRGSDAPGLLH